MWKAVSQCLSKSFIDLEDDDQSRNPLYLWIKTTLSYHKSNMLPSENKQSTTFDRGGWGEWDEKIKKIVNNGQWFVNFFYVEVVMGDIFAKLLACLPSEEIISWSTQCQWLGELTIEINRFSRDRPIKRSAISRFWRWRSDEDDTL